MSKKPAAQDLVKKAVKYHRDGKNDKAERLYKKILKDNPQSVDALHFLGVLIAQRGNTHKGIDLILQAIALKPDYVDPYINLGNIYLGEGEFQNTLKCYEKARSLDPARIQLISNLGILLKHLNRLEESEQHLRFVVQSMPNWAEGHFNLANTLARRKDYENALASYRKAIELNTTLQAAYQAFAQISYICGQQQQALDVLDKWRAADPDNPVLPHMYASYSGSDIPDRASDAYVASVFDTFANSFESNLERLEYRGPSILGDALERHLGAANASLTILDAGCGTGLSAPILKPYAKRLYGVDLSSQMLVKAQAKSIYNKLSCDNLETYLNQRKATFDLIAATDVLVYFGALDSVFKAADLAMRAGGVFIFTLEKTEQEQPYLLCPHGRYAHGRDYVTDEVASAGFQLVELSECVTRKELKEDVKSWLCVAQKKNQ